MPSVAISPVVRAILTANLDLSADEVIKRAKAKGVTAPDASIRTLVHNIKSELRKRKAAKAVPAAARQTEAPRATPPARHAAPLPATPADPPPVGELAQVLANVALVNKVVGAAGGPDQARQVAEAVRACGGVDAFLQHLDLVGGIRGNP